VCVLLETFLLVGEDMCIVMAREGALLACLSLFQEERRHVLRRVIWVRSHGRYGAETRGLSLFMRVVHLV